MLYNFGQVALLAPLANVLMLPAVPFAMAAGALATAAGLIWLPVGQALALLSWPFLSWLVLVARWLAELPGATVMLPAFGSGWVWGYYAVIAGWWLRRRLASCVAVAPLMPQ